MAWSASVTDKNFVDGIITVAVEYTDGSNTVVETYRNPRPTAEWIPNTVRDKIARLEAASAYDIDIGPVTPSDPDLSTPASAQLFINRCRLMLIVKAMIDLGAVQDTNPKVTALINWIQTNTSTYFDYLDK